MFRHPSKHAIICDTWRVLGAPCAVPGPQTAVTPRCLRCGGVRRCTDPRSASHSGCGSASINSMSRASLLGPDLSLLPHPLRAGTCPRAVLCGTRAPWPSTARHAQACGGLLPLRRSCLALCPEGVVWALLRNVGRAARGFAGGPSCFCLSAAASARPVFGSPPGAQSQ